MTFLILIYRVSRRYRTARKRRPNHLDSFKNDNQDVFWKIRFKTFLVELEFLKNMKKLKIFHIGEKSWSENHFDQFPSRILVINFFSNNCWFPNQNGFQNQSFIFFGPVLIPTRYPDPKGSKSLCERTPKRGWRWLKISCLKKNWGPKF